MEVEIDKVMLARAFKNVNDKLSLENKQIKRLYNKSVSDDTYYINNVIGELAELAFEATLKKYGYLNGIDSSKFGTFRNTDICDFYGSKSGRTIDIKTSHKKANKDLLVSKRVSDWRPIDEYILVKLHPSSNQEHTLSSIEKISRATIEGGIRSEKMSNIANLESGPTYITRYDNLEPIKGIIERNFFKANDRVERYESVGNLEVHVASIENGPASEIRREMMDRVKKVSRYYLNKPSKKTCDNFRIPFRNGQTPKESRLVVSFAIYDNDNKFSTALFIKSLISAEYTARMNKRTLVIPAYIEYYIPPKDLLTVEGVIKGLKCEIECNWTFISYY